MVAAQEPQDQTYGSRSSVIKNEPSSDANPVVGYISTFHVGSTGHYRNTSQAPSLPPSGPVSKALEDYHRSLDLVTAIKTEDVNQAREIYRAGSANFKAAAEKVRGEYHTQSQEATESKISEGLARWQSERSEGQWELRR